MKSIDSIYKAKLAARDKQKLAQAKKTGQLKQRKQGEEWVVVGTINDPKPCVAPNDCNCPICLGSLPSVEIPAPYRPLGMKLAAGRCTYYAAYHHAPTANGAPSTTITHLAMIEECGKPLTIARHKFSWFTVNTPSNPKTVGDALQENKPAFQCYTLPFMFHNRNDAIAICQKTILLQLQ